MTRRATAWVRRRRSHSARYSGSSRSPVPISSVVLRSLTFIAQLLHALCRKRDHALELSWVGLRFRSHSHDHEDVAHPAGEASPRAPSRHAAVVRAGRHLLASRYTSEYTTRGIARSPVSRLTPSDTHVAGGGVLLSSSSRLCAARGAIPVCPAMACRNAALAPSK